MLLGTMILSLRRASIPSTIKRLDRNLTVASTSFLQAPFTGTFSAQSGEVVGILKDMRDTFQRNLNQARLKEAAAVEANEKYLEAMGDALEAMEKSYQSKQGDLAANDESLGAKKENLRRQ